MSSLLNIIKEYKNRVASMEDEITRLKAGENGRAAGIEFSCAHLCPHCKGGDKPQRVSQEQIELANDRTFTFPGENPLDFYWRHTKRKGGTTPLCKSSSLHEAWRSENV